MAAAAKALRASRKYHAWNEDNYVTAYELARQGLTETKVAEAMGISLPTLYDWKKTKPAFASALKRGASFHKSEEGQVTFRDYVYRKLPAHLKELWDEINAWEGHRNNQKKVEALLKNQGKQVRQHLFIYALTASNFNASSACRKVNVSKATLDEWKLKDPDFAELLKEIDWHKGNFFEASLIRAVKRDDINAVLFANQTFNKDRGYGRTLDVKVEADIHHHHHLVDLEKLKLPEEVWLALHDAIEAQEEEEARIIKARDDDTVEGLLAAPEEDDE